MKTQNLQPTVYLGFDRSLPPEKRGFLKELENKLREKNVGVILPLTFTTDIAGKRIGHPYWREVPADVAVFICEASACVDLAVQMACIFTTSNVPCVVYRPYASACFSNTLSDICQGIGVPKEEFAGVDSLFQSILRHLQIP